MQIYYFDEKTGEFSGSGTSFKLPDSGATDKPLPQYDPTTQKVTFDIAKDDWVISAL